MRVSLVLLAFSITLLALSSGAPEFTCTTCHIDAGRADFTVLGLPLTYSPGGVYRITVEVVKGPVSQGIYKGGLAVMVSGGRLVPLDEKTQLLKDASTGKLMLTHTEKGAKYRKWTFEWIAPKKPEKVTFKIAVIAANGDGSPFGDAYAAKEITLTPATSNTYTMIGNVLSITITLTQKPITLTKTVTQTVTTTCTVTQTVTKVTTMTQTVTQTVTVVNRQAEIINKVLLLLLGIMIAVYLIG